MRFLIIRTDIRTVANDEVAAAWTTGDRLRDEVLAPEARRQIVHADDRDAALVLARALANVGAVRAGRQRVKVLPVVEPDRVPRPPERRVTGGTHPGFIPPSGLHPGATRT